MIWYFPRVSYLATALRTLSRHQCPRIQCYLYLYQYHFSPVLWSLTGVCRHFINVTKWSTEYCTFFWENKMNDSLLKSIYRSISVSQLVQLCTTPPMLNTPYKTGHCGHVVPIVWPCCNIENNTYQRTRKHDQWIVYKVTNSMYVTIEFAVRLNYNLTYQI